MQFEGIGANMLFGLYLSTASDRTGEIFSVIIMYVHTNSCITMPSQ